MSCLLASILHSFVIIIVITLTDYCYHFVLNSREVNNNQIKDVTNLGKAENLTFWSLQV